MDSVSIELWLDKRQLAALEQALTEDGTTVERTISDGMPLFTMKGIIPMSTWSATV